MKKILTVFGIIVCCLLICNVGVSYGFEIQDLNSYNLYSKLKMLDATLNVKDLNNNIFNTAEKNVSIGGSSLWWIDSNISVLESNNSGIEINSNPLLINLGYNFGSFNSMSGSIIASFRKYKLDVKVFSKDKEMPEEQYFALSFYNKIDVGNNFIFSSMISGSCSKLQYLIQETNIQYYNNGMDKTISTYSEETNEYLLNLTLMLSVAHNYNLFDRFKLVSKIDTDLNIIGIFDSDYSGSSNLVLSPSIELGLMKDIFYNTIAPSVYVKYDANLINRKEYFYLNDDKTNKTEKMKLHDDCFEYGAKLNIHLLDNIDFKVLYSKNSNKVSNFGGSFGVKF